MLWNVHCLPLCSVSTNESAGAGNRKLHHVNMYMMLQNPDDMYAELLEQLDAVEGALPLAAVSHIKPKERGAEGDKDKEKQQERERQKEREKAQAAKAQLAARGGL